MTPDACMTLQTDLVLQWLITLVLHGFLILITGWVYRI